MRLHRQPPLWAQAQVAPSHPQQELPEKAEVGAGGSSLLYRWGGPPRDHSGGGPTGKEALILALTMPEPAGAPRHTVVCSSFTPPRAGRGSLCLRPSRMASPPSPEEVHRSLEAANHHRSPQKPHPLILESGVEDGWSF